MFIHLFSQASQLANLGCSWLSWI